MASVEAEPWHTLALVLNAVADAAIGADSDGRIRIWNPAAAGLLGHDIETIAGRRVTQIVQSDPEPEFASIVTRTAAGETVGPFEASLIAADRRRIPVSMTVVPVGAADGVTAGFIVLARPFEDRPASEMSMQIADARWRALIDAAVDGMIVIDGGGSIEAFNPAAEQMFGYGVAEVLGQKVNMLMPSPDREQHDQYLSRYLETGIQRIIGIGRDVTALHRDGTRFPVHLSVGQMRVAGQTHFVGIVHDLRTRAQLEERLREQASLAQLGEMAAVLAHEVKNPLAAVRGAIQVLGKRYVTDDRDAQIVNEIVLRLDGLNALVQDLLLFARTPTPRPTIVELRAILNATIALLARDPHFAGVEVRVDGDAPPLPVDIELMKIAFQNVLLNAAQALEGKGRIHVAIAGRDDRQLVTIRDDGPGMSAATRARLFQPFFTTKARGTGLGLATVRRLVTAHDGVIAVECPETGGTIVTIDLPARPVLGASVG